MAEDERYDMEITEAELGRLITYDEEKKKYIGVCPVENCGKSYEIGSKGFAIGNLKRHLTKQHGIEVVIGAKTGESPEEGGGIFRKVNPVPAKVRELLTDYAGVDDRIAKKIVELLDKNPVLTENPNNLFNFLSRAKGMDPTLAKNIVDLVFSQAAYEQQLQGGAGNISPVFPQMGQGFGFGGGAPISAGPGGIIQPGQTGAAQPQVAYIPNPGGGMTPVIINIPPQVPQGQKQSQTPMLNIPPSPPASSSDDKYLKFLEERVKDLERDKERPPRREDTPVERVTEKVAMRRIREPIFAENEAGDVQIGEDGKAIVLDYREVEEPVFMDGGPTPQINIPQAPAGGEDPFRMALTILEKTKNIFAPGEGAVAASTSGVDEEKILMKSIEAAKTATEGKVKEIEGEVKKIGESTRDIDRHIDGKVGEVRDIVKDMKHNSEKIEIAERAAKDTYEHLKPFIASRTDSSPPGLTPQQYAMTQVRQMAGEVVSNIRAGFDSLGQRFDKFSDAQKITQMATSMLASGVSPDQVEKIIFQYVRGQMSPEMVEHAAAHNQGSVATGEKEAFLDRLRSGV